MDRDLVYPDPVSVLSRDANMRPGPETIFIPDSPTHLTSNQNKTQIPLALLYWLLRRLMGNCMERSAPSLLQEEDTNTAEEEKTGDGGVGGSCKVKILLTRKELQWLVLQLKEKGEQRLEDVLLEMEERGKIKGWKPALESIVESPIIHKLDGPFELP
ncbi:hypothetical protein Cni_G09482 [Canna indica]|uniref:Uncharacterized protein n=1 Tax=Canna indica TaxID=4628 RepID=A0AAQ3K433_9LILI|nr:hypothetical protein Cni_G09482 [Canna indica]